MRLDDSAKALAGPKSRLMQVLVAVSALVLGIGIPTQSAAPKPVTRHFGPVSAVQGQQAIVSLSNLRDVTVQPRVALVDQNGEVLTQGRPTIEPGASAQVSSLMEEEGIYYLRARITAPKNVMSGLASALHILDADGATFAMADTALPASSLQSESLCAAMVHLGEGQALRVLVTNLRGGSGNNTFEVSAVDAAGAIASSLDIPNLAKGETGAAAFSSETSDVRPVVGGPGGSHSLITVEIYEPDAFAKGVGRVALGFKTCTGPAG